MPEEATLSNEKNYTVFQFNGHIIRFTAPYSLEYYTDCLLYTSPSPRDRG